MAGTGTLEPGMYSFDDYNPSAIPQKLLDYKLKHSSAKMDRVQKPKMDQEVLRSDANPEPMTIGGGVWDDILNGVNDTVNTGLNIFGKVAPFLAMM